MTFTFDETAYSNLLAEVAPKVIETEEEYERLLVVAERLTFVKNRTQEERVLHKLLSQLTQWLESKKTGF
ncbi:hypothetical protein [Nostoc sp.]|uniref:hypothetical protein n=1 Tax=Nostoc sp. TaxID=1180 RepID=UPI0035934D2E